MSREDPPARPSQAHLLPGGAALRKGPAGCRDPGGGKWERLTAPHGAPLQVCKYDFVEVRSGLSPDARLHGKFCGSGRRGHYFAEQQHARGVQVRAYCLKAWLQGRHFFSGVRVLGTRPQTEGDRVLQAPSLRAATYPSLSVASPSQCLCLGPGFI